MASSYFFLREDQKCGPVSSSQLKTMAASGLIGPDDLVWKEGFPKWIQARNLKGLFPEVSSSGQPHPLPNRVVENQSRSNSPSLGSDPDASGDSVESEDQKSPVLSEVQHETILEQAADAVTSFKKNAGDATRLVANRSERVKISNWSLPKAYAALGRDCFQNQRHEITLSEHYENLKSIQNELSQIKAKSDSLETSGTLSDKVKTGATKAAIFAQAKVLEAKASSVLVQIGKTAFKEYGSEAGPEELVERVEKSLRRISELDEENAALGQAHKGKWITKKRLKYGLGALASFWIIGVLLGPSERNSVIPGGPNASNKSRRSNSIADSSNSYSSKAMYIRSQAANSFGDLRSIFRFASPNGNDRSIHEKPKEWTVFNKSSYSCINRLEPTPLESAVILWRLWDRWEEGPNGSTYYYWDEGDSYLLCVFQGDKFHSAPVNRDLVELPASTKKKWEAHMAAGMKIELCNTPLSLTGDPLNIDISGLTPFSREDFLKATEILGGSFGHTFEEEGVVMRQCVSKISMEEWSEVFPEFERLPDNYDSFINKDYQRWRVQCIDGPITMHGNISGEFMISTRACFY